MNGARPGPGNVITHPHVGLPGADGTTALVRCGRAGKLFRIFGFQKRERQRDRARERERERERDSSFEKRAKRFSGRELYLGRIRPPEDAVQK